MTITAAQIEASGWVLRVTLTGSVGSFASYALDPDGSPKVSLACTHPGFAPSGGTAVAASLARTLVATKPLRKPANFSAGALQPFAVDETDNGDGTITVRLALSDYVHATETGVSASFAAGWRTGEAAATPTITNNSTFVAAVPIFRWSDVPYQRQTGSFALELVAFSHHVQGLAPLAGVKFTVTDGTTVKTYWATALSTSTRHGDNARVYGVTVDPATATALTAGLLRCDAELYPWLGVMRSTDPAGTRSMSGLATASFNTPAQTPFVVAWDPGGTRYGSFAVLDPVNGTTTASAAQVQSTLALARGVAAASKPRDVATAMQAGYLANRGLSAANGQASQTRALDGLTIVVPSGTSQIGSTAITFGSGTYEAWLEIVGDPADSNPRANCLLQGPSVSTVSRVSRARFANLTLELDTVGVFDSVLYYWLDNVEVRGKAGKETTASCISTTTGALFYTRSRVWKTLRGMTYQSFHRPFLLRACEGSRRMEAMAVLGCTFLGNSVDTFAPAAGTGGEIYGTGGWGNQIAGNGDLGSQEDVIIAGCDLRNQTVRVWRPAKLLAATAGTPNPSYRRQVFANNLCERVSAGGSTEPFWSCGEDESATISYNIVEGNSFIGERCNVFYSDPVPTTVAETNSLLNQAFGNRFANNVCDWVATKHDAFFDDVTASLRGSATNGYRPQMTAAWSITYGVGWEGNYDYGRHASAGVFQFEYFGRRSVQLVGGTPGWPADRSRYGSPTTGGGTYKPPAGSALIGRGLRSSTDRDRSGAGRVVPFAAGALDTPAPVVLAPAKAVSASRGSRPSVGWRATLVAAGARSAQRATSPGVNWRGTLAPAAARSATRNALPSLRWFAVLTPATARSTSRSGSPLLGWRGALVPLGGTSALRGTGPLLSALGPTVFTLSPAAGRSPSRDRGVAVLPDLIFAGAGRLVHVEGDLRVRLVAGE